MQSSVDARTGDASRSATPTHRIPVVALGMGLSAFLVISYVICVVGYLLLPDLPFAHNALTTFLPGFTLLSWRSLFLGLIESVLWGWYIAIVFGPLYNFFARRFA